jgi:hypothetical protein
MRRDCLESLLIPCLILDDGFKEVLRQPMFGNLCIPYLALDEFVVKTQIRRFFFLVEEIQIRDLWGNQSFNWKQIKKLGYVPNDYFGNNSCCFH